MTRTQYWMIIVLLMSAVIPACKGRNQPARGSSTSSSSPSKTNGLPETTNVTDKWLGKWTGPEGTYLVLSKSANKYVVLIHSLDGPATYEGTSNGQHIEFQRDGQTESIHAGGGRDTGMKWLMDKTDCLIIKTGEGFCRD